MEEYDTVGSLAFITDGSRDILKVATSATREHREYLDLKPDPAGPFIVEQHSMKNYLAIIQHQ